MRLIPARNLVWNAKAQARRGVEDRVGQRIADLARDIRVGSMTPEDLTSADREMVQVYLLDHPRQ